MTHPHRRLSDQSTKERLFTWWHKNGVAIVGYGLILVSVLLMVVAVQFYSSQASTRHQAKAACERSLRFGPELAKAYAKYQILTPAALAEYKAGIPTKC